MFERLAEQPTPQLREKLIRELMPFARGLARRYSRTAEPLDDLVQVANLALVKAVDAYDPRRGIPFKAFAAPTILGELKRHFRDRVWTLRLPRGLQEVTARIEKATTALTADLGRAPTVKELAHELELSTEDVLEGIEASHARRTGSLDAPLRNDRDDDRGTVMDTLAEEDSGFDRAEAEAAAESAELTAREREILRLRFVDGLTQSKIGQRIGVSQMQVSRESRRALRKLLAAVQGEPSAS